MLFCGRIFYVPGSARGSVSSFTDGKNRSAFCDRKIGLNKSVSVRWCVCVTCRFRFIRNGLILTTLVLYIKERKHESSAGKVHVWSSKHTDICIPGKRIEIIDTTEEGKKKRRMVTGRPEPRFQAHTRASTPNQPHYPAGGWPSEQI